MIANEDRLKTLYDRVNSRIDQFERERYEDEQMLEERRREELRKNDEEWERIFGWYPPAFRVSGRRV